MAKFIVTLEVEFDPCKKKEGRITRKPEDWDWKDAVTTHRVMGSIEDVKILNVSPVSGLSDAQMARMTDEYRIMHGEG